MPRVMSCFFLLNLACEWCVIKCVCVCVFVFLGHLRLVAKPEEAPNDPKSDFISV